MVSGSPCFGMEAPVAVVLPHPLVPRLLSPPPPLLRSLLPLDMVETTEVPLIAVVADTTTTTPTITTQAEVAIVVEQEMNPLACKAF